jgi:serine/threonine protein kinase
LDKELFVDSNVTDETEFPVLLMDWVEGKTLDKYIRENIDDHYALEILAYQFSQLAMWLLPQPFAHGDLKPDNIIVRENGSLVLVDYDGMYVPAMKGQKARELGSPDFRHPSRNADEFNEHIDDFPIASILLSLKAISLNPDLLKEFGASDRLLFSEKDYRNLSESMIFDALKPLLQDAEFTSLFSLFLLASSQNNLSQVSSRLLNLSRPKELEFEYLCAEVTKVELAKAWTDEYGVKYSQDKKCLLRAPRNIKKY